MTNKLKANHRMRIRILSRKGKFAVLDQYLEKIAAKGFDVAGVPFQVLDAHFASPTPIPADELRPLARHTLGAQPRLFKAITDDLSGEGPSALVNLVRDQSAHTMTRFEAMGWTVFLTHKATAPQRGAPVSDVFQFWDDPVPPKDVADGRAQWKAVSPDHAWYDDHAARQYITEGFGRAAADAFDALWHPALKSDVFRLYRLARDGGVYCDADSVPGLQIAEFFQYAGNHVWASSMTQVPNCVTANGFIAAPAGSPLIEGLLEFVLGNIRDARDRGIFWLSGPGAMTVYLYRNPGSSEMRLLPNAELKSGIFSQFDAPYKRTTQNWRVYEHGLGLTNDAGLSRALKDPG